jgi:hypothetical protein
MTAVCRCAAAMQAQFSAGFIRGLGWLLCGTPAERNRDVATRVYHESAKMHRFSEAA